MNQFIYFEESWNIYDGGASPASQTPDAAKGSRGPDQVYSED